MSKKYSEYELTNCSYCNKPIELEWIMENGKNMGLAVEGKEFLLVADWVYHNECWDRLVNEFPPD